METLLYYKGAETNIPGSIPNLQRVNVFAEFDINSCQKPNLHRNTLNYISELILTLFNSDSYYCILDTFELGASARRALVSKLLSVNNLPYYFSKSLFKGTRTSFLLTSTEHLLQFTGDICPFCNHLFIRILLKTDSLQLGDIYHHLKLPTKNSEPWYISLLTHYESIAYYHVDPLFLSIVSSESLDELPFLLEGLADKYE